MALHHADHGSCEGHRCDGCPTCLEGRCCGETVAEPNLPRQGSWPDEMHGEVGVLVEKNGRVQCHVCGRWFVELGRHVATKHRLTADAYRATFGLACRRPLCPAWLSEQRSANARAAGLGFQRTQNLELTSEQRSLIAYRREARAETAVSRREHLVSIASAGAAARWADRRPQSEDPEVRLRRHALPEVCP